MENYTFRLLSGQDLFDSIESFVKEKHIEAGCVLSSVESLTKAVLRLANREFHTEYNGYFEIVSMTGTVSIYGSHLHMVMSDGRWAPGEWMQNLHNGRGLFLKMPFTSVSLQRTRDMRS